MRYRKEKSEKKKNLEKKKEERKELGFWLFFFFIILCLIRNVSVSKFKNGVQIIFYSDVMIVVYILTQERKMVL